MKSNKTLVQYNIEEVPDHLQWKVKSEMLKIFDRDIDNHLACQNHGSYETLYCVLNMDDQDKFMNLLDECGVLIDHKDLTQEIKDGKYNLVDKEDEFNVVFENFINDNLSVDYILDKISKYGIQSLNNKEVQFLNNV